MGHSGHSGDEVDDNGKGSVTSKHEDRPPLILEFASPTVGPTPTSPTEGECPFSKAIYHTHEVSSNLYTWS